MTKPLWLAAIFLAAGCSRQPAKNYRNCLKLRVGMTREQVFAVMGPPGETLPYIEGKSLPHLKGRIAYEWSTPASMPAPCRVSVDEASGKAESIRCADSVVTTAVYIEPPEPAAPTAPISALSSPITDDARPAPSRRGTRERSSSSAQSSGRPLTE